MATAWNQWYHCVGHTYGSWLPGDPRGWRSRKHRVHVEGDYKNPPPLGTNAGLHRFAKDLMTHDAVVLDPAQRRIVLEALKEALAFHQVPVAALGVSATHAHVLARFERGRRTQTGKLVSDPPRHFFGIARKRAARRLSELGVDRGGVAAGGVWSKHTQALPIRDRAHFENTRRYIREHAGGNAVVWVPESDCC